MQRRIWLVRHGESEANAGLRTTEAGGVLLTETGHRQAADFAGLVDERPSLIVTSPFIRTGLTAAPLRARFPDVPHEEWPVHEFTYLAVEVTSHTTYQERLPQIKAYWERLDPHVSEGPGTESFVQMIERARAALTRFETAPPGLTVIFSHAQFMRAFRILARMPDAEPREMMAAFLDDARRDSIQNCGVLTFERG